MAGIVKRFWPLLVAVAATGAIIGWGTIRFGSFAAARAFLRGEPIVAEPSVIDLGVIKANVPSVATVLLRNLSNKEVRITGAKGTCDCVATSMMPVTVSADSTVTIELNALPDDMATVKGFRESMSFFVYGVDAPVIVTVLARVE